jgi:putrescine transport system permease protein
VNERPPTMLMSVLAIGVALLYIPMLVMIGYSFNASPLVGIWGGFSTHWYRELVHNDQLISAAWLSLRIGFVAATAAASPSPPWSMRRW